MGKKDNNMDAIRGNKGEEALEGELEGRVRSLRHREVHDRNRWRKIVEAYYYHSETKLAPYPLSYSFFHPITL